MTFKKNLDLTLNLSNGIYTPHRADNSERKYKHVVSNILRFIIVGNLNTFSDIIGLHFSIDRGTCFIMERKWFGFDCGLKVTFLYWSYNICSVV